MNLKFFYDISGLRWYHINRRLGFWLYRRYGGKLKYSNGVEISLKELRREFVITKELGGLYCNRKTCIL